MNSANNNPCVTVIVPVYNSVHLLPAALETVFNQTFQDFEIILIDDGSTDGSLELLKTYESRARVLTQTNSGASSARNKGIAMAHGEFIAFLDSDDLWDPKKLEMQVAVFRENPETGVCFTDCLYFDATKEWDGNFRRYPNLNGMVFDALLVDHFVSTSAVMVRHDCLKDVGVFDETLIGCEDYNLYLRLAQKYPYRFIPEPLVKLRCHEGNLSNNLPQMCRDEISNLDKIAEMFPEMEIPKNKIKSDIFFRFGQYYFDANDFRSAKKAFRAAIKFKPKKFTAYIYLLLSIMPSALRSPLRNIVRSLRGTRQQNVAS
jgi:glycosyltransferase involved in cell wall biosynthesis